MDGILSYIQILWNNAFKKIIKIWMIVVWKFSKSNLKELCWRFSDSYDSAVLVTNSNISLTLLIHTQCPTFACPFSVAAFQTVYNWEGIIYDSLPSLSTNKFAESIDFLHEGHNIAREKRRYSLNRFSKLNTSERHQIPTQSTVWTEGLRTFVVICTVLKKNGH